MSLTDQKEDFEQWMQGDVEARQQHSKNVKDHYLNNGVQPPLKDKK